MLDKATPTTSDTAQLPPSPRRSGRKPKSVLELEKQEMIEARLLATDDDDLGLKVIYGELGRGVITIKDIKKGDFVCEYKGGCIYYAVID